MTLQHEHSTKHRSAIRGLARAPFLGVSIIGTALIAVALLASGAMILWQVDHHDNPGLFAVLSTARNLLGAGMVLIVYASLRRRGRDTEEAYRLGYDVGFENGYRAGREARDMTTGQFAVGGEVVPFVRDRR